MRTLLRELRHVGAVPVLLRSVVLLSSAVTMGATIAPAWDVPSGYMILAGIAAVGAAAAPDTGAGALFAVAIVAGWATGVDEPGVGPAVVVAAMAMLAGHVAGALAAAMPVTAGAEVRLALRWWRPTAVLAGATLAAAVLVAVLDAWSRPGSIVVVLAALTAVGAAVWWAAADG